VVAHGFTRPLPKDGDTEKLLGDPTRSTVVPRSNVSMRVKDRKRSKNGPPKNLSFWFRPFEKMSYFLQLLIDCATRMIPLHYPSGIN